MSKKSSLIKLTVLFWAILMFSIAANAQQRPTWKVEMTPSSDSLNIHVDARHIPNSSYLQNVSVFVNFFDERGRRLNRRPQKFELHAEGIVDIFRQGEYDFKFPLPYQLVRSVKGTSMKCQQVVNGRFVNRDIPPIRIAILFFPIARPHLPQADL